MEHTKKVSVIVGVCILLTAVFSAIILWKTLRPSKGLSYEQITMEQAAEYMEYETDYILLDVRTEEEYATGHIPGAICISHDEIGEKADAMLPDKEQMIYVYCRSGNRSQQAAQALCDLGYTNVTEMGGIIDWTGETEK